MSKDREQARTALVSGASRGIGAAIALRLAENGMRVIGIHRSRSDSADQVGKTLDAVSPGSGLRLCDTADRDAVAALFAAIKADGRVVTDLVNCAGITDDRAVATMPDDVWDRVVETNLTGTFNLTRAFTLPAMRAQFGVITNISSIAGVYGNPGQVNYSATKGGIDAMTRTLSRELGRSGIRVNSVAPGFIESDMTAAFTPDQVKALVKKVSLRRIGRPEDVAGLVGYLHGDDASYITGQTIVIDGGTTL
ncbi:3-oxoacyl-ACP reductase FabG [Nocardia sp. NPDC088792]|uniref:3-oxoacyl-ACP reductase FabG n=1 Tax=Nocardia sp. NPDC088792 TaxID=3364332 RepID=UPI0037FEED0F